MKASVSPVYKHPQIYSDLLSLYRRYWNVHRHSPRPFRLTTGENILEEITGCIKCVVRVNGFDKKDKQKRIQASMILEQVRASLMTIRGLITLGWDMKFISHGAFADLVNVLDSLEKQTTRWRGWFDAPY